MTLAVVLLLATVVGGVDIVVDGHRRPFRSIKAPKGIIIKLIIDKSVIGSLPIHHYV